MTESQSKTSNSTEVLVDKVPDPISAEIPTGDRSNDESSINTEEALLEMLGLSTSGGRSLPMTDDDDDDDDCSQVAPLCPETEKMIRNINIPSRCSRYLHPPNSCAAFVMEDFLSGAECRRLIHMAASLNLGFRYIKEATHTAPDGSAYTVRLQNPNPHKLSVFEHPPTVERMWRSLEGRMLPHIRGFAERTGCGPPLGLNPRLRVLRYDSADGDRFEPHFDATTVVGPRSESLLTVLVYLNDGGGEEFDGGGTVYLDSVSPRSGDAVKVTPSAGRVVVFEHDLFHSGAPLRWGTKYIMRTDVLFGVRVESSKASRSDGAEQQRPWSIVELCDKLQLLEKEKQILDDLGLLEVTVDSFLAPGITVLKMMLGEGLEVNTIERLICEAIKTAKESKG